ncbi:hypothetical protein DSCO28_34730 [Desulfosarcina ovata subsp. sediminis]|uniref:histidine kinase n=1 Tax=Desulfosarcina ovata subsp. sediminis TaxID=885957 RepID=A0A5K7ZPZ6_9BACT|nr:PAS domain-containing protein [Desulfosarcina ovata]BBO82907.1 hypothetical protein DSCO28_34730 [Desulfosarcina ovata subsp. sediminis]
MADSDTATDDKPTADLLIVDNAFQVRNILVRYLEEAGYRCITAASVDEAKALLATRPVDMILSDIDMPGVSGIELFRYAATACPDTPIIVVSVIDTPQKAKEVLEFGVYGYIVKPFTRNIVLITIENALRRKQLEAEKGKYLRHLEEQVRQRTENLSSQLLFHQNIINSIPIPIFYKDHHGRYQGCNTAFESIVGQDRESILGKTVTEIAFRLPADFVQDMDRRVIEEPCKLSYEAAIDDNEGHPRHVIFNKARYPDVNGEIAGIVGVMTDITECRQMEAELRVSEEKFRQIVENIGIGVAVIGREMEVLWMNSRMGEWFAEARAGEGMMCYRSFIKPPRDVPCPRCPTVRALKEGVRCEATFGEGLSVRHRQFRIIASPIHDKDDRVVAAIELVEDITEKIALERDRQQAQKLESIGQLAAGIAHEINTPTQYIGDNTRFIQESTDDLLGVLSACTDLLAAVKAGAPTRTAVQTLEQRIEAADLDYLRTEMPLAIEQTLEGITRVSDIVTSMRRFSHPGSDRKSPVDLNEALESTVTVARNEWKYVADLEVDLDPELPLVRCLPGEMNQVFLNLLINAAHAIGDNNNNGETGKGRIRISTRKNGQTVQIRIADNGGGIPESIRERVFDPFFTTKAVGRGTGQGLAIAHTVITEKHDGTIHFESRQGKGTVFIIDLPIGPTDRQGKFGQTDSGVSS